MTKISKVRQFLFHPFEKYTLSRSSRNVSKGIHIFLTAITLGIWQIPFWIVNRLDRKRIKKGSFENDTVKKIKSKGTAVLSKNQPKRPGSKPNAVLAKPMQTLPSHKLTEEETLQFPDIDIKEFDKKYKGYAPKAFRDFIDKLNKENCQIVKKIPLSYWNNQLLVESILKIVPDAWVHVPKEVQEDHNILVMAFPYLKGYVNEKLAKNRSFIKKLFAAVASWKDYSNYLNIRIDYYKKVFEFAAEELRNNLEFLSEVLMDNIYSENLFEGFSEALRENKSFILQASKKIIDKYPDQINSGRFCRSLPKILLEDEPFLIELIKIDHHVYHFLPDDLQRKTSFGIEAYKVNVKVETYLGWKVTSDPEFKKLKEREAVKTQENPKFAKETILKKYNEQRKAAFDKTSAQLNQAKTPEEHIKLFHQLQGDYQKQLAEIDAAEKKEIKELS